LEVYLPNLLPSPKPPKPRYPGKSTFQGPANLRFGGSGRAAKPPNPASLGIAVWGPPRAVYPSWEAYLGGLGIAVSRGYTPSPEGTLGRPPQGPREAWGSPGNRPNPPKPLFDVLAQTVKQGKSSRISLSTVRFLFGGTYGARENALFRPKSLFDGLGPSQPVWTVRLGRAVWTLQTAIPGGSPHPWNSGLEGGLDASKPALETSPNPLFPTLPDSGLGEVPER
jgi:hypothetical protein